MQKLDRVRYCVPAPLTAALALETILIPCLKSHTELMVYASACPRHKRSLTTCEGLTYQERKNSKNIKTLDTWAVWAN